MKPKAKRRRTVAVAALGAAFAFSASVEAQQQPPRPMFLAGKVALSDGTLPPVPALVKLRCQGQEQPQGYSGPKGQFSFQIGRRRNQTPNDATQRAPSTMETFGGPSAGLDQINGATALSLIGCVLRAHLDGYTSSIIELSGRRPSDDPNVGTIILSRVGGSVPDSVSLASLVAPDNARRAYEQGVQAFEKRKFPKAEKQFRSAVEIYPEYAEAWQELGATLYARDKDTEASEAFSRAVTLNAGLVKPYLYLSLITARDKKWQEAATYSDQLLELEPEDYPEAYYYNAVAYYNLQDQDRALASAEHAVELDLRQEVPLARQLLGIMLARKGDFSRAAEQFRSFIAHALPGTNLGPTRQMLASAERNIRRVQATEISSR